MNANEIVLKFTLDIKGIKSALTQVEKDLKNFGSKSEGATEGLNNALEETEQQLNNINAASRNFAQPAVQEFANLRKGAGAANGSVIAFGRIIQDAPFGILGVANNIQSFSEQFSALGTQAGAAGSKLKLFFSALITPTNLAVLAVSALTAAWQAYSLGLFDSAEETKDLNKELEDYKENLDGVSKAQLDGVQSAQKEIQALNLLRAQAENDGLSREKRLLAVKELKKEWPEYLKGFSDEEILLGKVGNAYIQLTKKLTAYSTAQALSGRVGENNAKAAVLQFQEEERAIKILAKRAESEAATRMQTSRLKNADQFTVADPTVLRIQKELNDLIQETTDSSKEREKLAIENLALNKKITQEIANAGGLIDASINPLEKINRELNYWELTQDRINQKTDVEKKVLEDLAQQQRNLFREVRTLRQEPINFINTASLIAAEIKLKEIDKILGSLEYKREEIEIKIDPTKLEGLELPATKENQELGIIEGLQKQIESFEKLKQVTSDPTMLALYTLQIDLLKNKLAEFNGEEVKSNLQLIADAFGSMGQQIANSLNISNKSLRGFVTTLVSATPKIVAAIQAKAQATDSAADKETIANAKLAAGNSVVVATEGAKALGPVGLALLPVFIAGALALVSSAFGKAGGGGGSVSAGSGSTFTNRREFGGPVSKGRAYIVGEKRPELFVPNTNGIIVPQVPSMDYSGARVSSSMYGVEVMLKGPDDLLFFVEQAQIRRGIR